MKKHISFFLAVATIFLAGMISSNVTMAQEPEASPAGGMLAPVISYSDYRYVIFDGEAPEHYINITKNYFEDRFGSLFAFCGEGGETQWRIYAERDRYEDDVIVETEKGFLAANVGSVVIRVFGDPCFTIDPDEEAGFVEYETEVFGKSVPAKNKREKYSVTKTAYGTYDDVAVVGKNNVTYSYFYPAADGEIADGALPVKTDKNGNIGYYVPGGDLIIIDKGDVKKK